MINLAPVLVKWMRIVAINAFVYLRRDRVVDATLPPTKRNTSRCIGVSFSTENLAFLGGGLLKEF